MFPLASIDGAVIGSIPVASDKPLSDTLFGVDLKTIPALVKADKRFALMSDTLRPQVQNMRANLKRGLRLYDIVVAYHGALQFTYKAEAASDPFVSYMEMLFQECDL